MVSEDKATRGCEIGFCRVKSLSRLALRVLRNWDKLRFSLGSQRGCLPRDLRVFKRCELSCGSGMGSFFLILSSANYIPQARALAALLNLKVQSF